MLGKQQLESNTEQIIQRFGDPDERNFDGIYLKGKQAVQHYTRSFLNVLLDSLPNSKTPEHISFNTEKFNTPRSYASKVNSGAKPTVPQPGFQANRYSVPVSNRYTVLGNI